MKTEDFEEDELGSDAEFGLRDGQRLIFIDSESRAKGIPNVGNVKSILNERFPDFAIQTSSDPRFDVRGPQAKISSSIMRSHCLIVIVENWTVAGRDSLLKDFIAEDYMDGRLIAVDLGGQVSDQEGAWLRNRRHWFDSDLTNKDDLTRLADRVQQCVENNDNFSNPALQDREDAKGSGDEAKTPPQTREDIRREDREALNIDYLALTDDSSNDAGELIQSHQYPDMSVWETASSAKLLKAAMESLSPKDVQKSSRSQDDKAQVLLALSILFFTDTPADADLKRAEALLRSAAEKGNARAKFELARLLRSHVPDDSEAIALLTKACEENIIRAIPDLAGYLLTSKTRRKSKLTAVHDLLEKGIVINDPECVGLKGWLTFNGIGIRRNKEHGILLWREAARRDDPFSMAALGNAFLRGNGVRQRLETAVDFFRKSASQGHPWGNYYLAWVHERGVGVHRDRLIARKHYAIAVEQGDEDAKYALARMLMAGEGGPKDLENAVSLLLSIENAHAGATYLIGKLKEIGAMGEIDIEGAIENYEIAAESREPRAQYALAQHLERGANGIERDRPRAVNLLKSVARQRRNMSFRFRARKYLSAMGERY
ncbi:MAG: hypothetical protein Hens2KO_27820 [Henriciella sp.]